MIPTVKLIKRTYGYDNVEVTLDDGFKARLLFAAVENIADKLDEPFLLEMAEQRRTTRSSFTMKENTKGDLYYGKEDNSSPSEAGVQPEAEGLVGSGSHVLRGANSQ